LPRRVFVDQNIGALAGREVDETLIVQWNGVDAVNDYDVPISGTENRLGHGPALGVLNLGALPEPVGKG